MTDVLTNGQGERNLKPSRIGYVDYSSGDLNFATGCTPVSEGCAK